MVEIAFNFIFYSINYIFRGFVGSFDALHIHGYVSLLIIIIIKLPIIIIIYFKGSTSFTRFYTSW